MSEFYKRILSSLLLLPLTFFFIYKGNFIFILCILIIFIISLYEWFKLSLNKSIFIIGFIFLIFSFFSLYKIRFININDNINIFTIFFILIVCISTDIGGYIFGKLINGPKLTKYSPNKTYAGSIGGILLSIILSQIYINKFNYLISIKIEFSYSLYFFVLMISIISQLGDITISVLKRKKNLKDTGKLIPGHGGLLDRVDGMIFVFPLVYLLNLYNFFI